MGLGGRGENFETFCAGVGKILGLGGSKYRPPPPRGVLGGWQVDPLVSAKRSLVEAFHNLESKCNEKRACLLFELSCKAPPPF